MGEIVKPGIVLFIITLIAAISLGFVNDITRGPIEQQEKIAVESAMQEILPSAKEFKQEINVSADDAVTEVVTGYDGGSVVGYIMTVAPKGYGGLINLLVALNAEGKIEGLKIINHQETPGLGANADTPEFYNNYIGKNGILSVTKNAPGDTEIQAITSATITTNAITSGVNTCTEFFNNNIQKGGTN